MKKIPINEYRKSVTNTKVNKNFTVKEKKILEKFSNKFTDINNIYVNLTDAHLSFNYSKDTTLYGDNRISDTCDVYVYKFDNTFVVNQYNYINDNFVYYILGDIKNINSPKLHYILMNLGSNSNIEEVERDYNIKQILT